MLLIVCPNPTLDCFATQTASGVTIYSQRAGGKGINVGRTLRQLDTKAKIITPVGGFNGYHVRKLLKAERLPARTIMGHVNTRQLIYTQNETGVSKQEIAFIGHNPEAFATFTKALIPYFKKANAVLFCGSLPSSFPTDSYVQWIHALHTENKDCPVYIDSRGQIIRDTLQNVSVTGVKINRREWEAWKDMPFSKDTFLEEAKADASAGRMTHIIVTDAGNLTHGALNGEAMSAMPYIPNDIATDTSKHPTGSEDAFMAGWVWALAHQKLSATEAFQAGTLAAGHHYFGVPLSRRGLRDALSQVEVLPL
jgi:fructose-1-phosphate kinase PfkB-like protein